MRRIVQKRSELKMRSSANEKDWSNLRRSRKETDWQRDWSDTANELWQSDGRSKGRENLYSKMEHQFKCKIGILFMRLSKIPDSNCILPCFSNFSSKVLPRFQFEGTKRTHRAMSVGRIRLRKKLKKRSNRKGHSTKGTISMLKNKINNQRKASNNSNKKTR